MENPGNPPVRIIGGCLCGKVRYRAEIGNQYPWPPGPHTCSCTHCRKHTGTPFALFLTFTCRQLGWPNPLIGTPSAAAEGKENLAEDPYWHAAAPIKEYSHTPGRYRGFCGTCGSTMYWRCPSEDGDEIEMGVGTVDEEFLEKYGKVLCEPSRARFYSGKEVHGVGFGGEFNSGPRFKEGSRSERITS